MTIIIQVSITTFISVTITIIDFTITIITTTMHIASILSKPFRTCPQVPTGKNQPMLICNIPSHILIQYIVQMIFG